jgi:hypothetical protein
LLRPPPPWPPPKLDPKLLLLLLLLARWPWLATRAANSASWSKALAASKLHERRARRAA